VSKRVYITGVGIIALVLALLPMTGCDEKRIADALAGKRLPFNHKAHVKEQMKCTSCHKTAAKEDHAGMPTIKSCDKCHKGLDEKKPPERRVSSYVVDGKVEWSHITEPKTVAPDTIMFSHKTHVDAKVQCQTCHKGVEAATTLTAKLRVTMKECIVCHVKSHVAENAANGCLVCHTVIDKQWKPENHELNWKQLHGREIGFVQKDSPASCDLCHTQQSCNACHKENPPTSHTNFWRERGHGINADADRAQCKFCHTEDSCMRCHQTIAPQSHKGNFSGTHCTQCHFPLKQEGCVTCHKNTNSHNTAAKLPANDVHKTAKDSTCRDCHFGLKMLPHQDDGGSCLMCHKR